MLIGKVAMVFMAYMVTTVLQATTRRFWFAPAMNVNMYEKPAVIRNISTLAKDGYRFIEPSEGFLPVVMSEKNDLKNQRKLKTSSIEVFPGENHLRISCVKILQKDFLR